MPCAFPRQEHDACGQEGATSVGIEDFHTKANKADTALQAQTDACGSSLHVHGFTPGATLYGPEAIGSSRKAMEHESPVSIYRHPESGRVLSLVGAVHVADPSYFRAIQEELDRYDLVLFERVGTPDEKRDEKLAARLSIIGELQIELASLLELTHQSDAIDYSRANLRHADLSMAEFTARLEARGEPLIPAEGLLRFLAPFIKMSFAMTRSMRELDPQLTNRLRWQMARTMSDMSRLLDQLGIEEHENPDDVIIGVRNDHAWEVFHDSFPEGHQRIAIFYGAAHLPDFQRRLLEEGWKLEERRWVPAWNIPVPEKQRAGPVPTPLTVRKARL